MLEDMSRNGTFINGQILSRGTARVLKTGDHIQLYRRVAFAETDPRQRCKYNRDLPPKPEEFIPMLNPYTDPVFKIILAPNLEVPVSIPTRVLNLIFWRYPNV
jgi:pSer/pThr/pTyr-binding forkhead associated (FHA) protein